MALPGFIAGFWFVTGTFLKRGSWYLIFGILGEFTYHLGQISGAEDDPMSVYFIFLTKTTH